VRFAFIRAEKALLPTASCAVRLESPVAATTPGLVVHPRRVRSSTRSWCRSFERATHAVVRPTAARGSTRTCEHSTIVSRASASLA
jgi:hypothetical protein